MNVTTILTIICIAIFVISIVCINVSVSTIKQLKEDEERIYKNALWDSFIQNAKKMVFKDKIEYNGKVYYHFVYANRYVVTVVKYIDNHIKPYSYITLYNDKYINGDFILCSFNKEKSQQLADILINNNNVPLI